MFRTFIINCTTCICFALSTHAELRTVTLDTTVSNRSETISINEQQTIRFKCAWSKQSCVTPGLPQQPAVVWNIHGLVWTNGTTSFSDTGAVFTGPTSVYITSLGCDNQVAATFEIEPSAFPPDKALTLGAFSGNVKVTMEESTDHSVINLCICRHGVYPSAWPACFWLWFGISHDQLFGSPIS